MSMEILQKAFDDLGCLPHQAEFAAKFLAVESQRKHLLTSLPGLDKGFVGSAIVGYAATHGQARRVLVLAPIALGYQWVEMIRRNYPNIPCEFVDRRQLRELESQQQDGDSFRNQAGVVVMSIDFAKRPDIAEILTLTPCDLMVVDEAHQLTPTSRRQQVVTLMIDRNPAIRVLYLHSLFQTGTDKDSDNPLFKDVATNVWSRETVRDTDGKPLLSEVKLEWISHRRRPDEVELLSRLQEALKVIAGNGQQSKFIAMIVLRTASSSLFALEQQLNRMRRRRNEVAHGIGDNAHLGSNVNETDPTLDLDPSALMKFADRIPALLELLEDVDTDSKFESLLAVLDKLGVFSSSDRRVCIFTSYIDTASYLESSLSEHHSYVAAVTGSLPFAEREQAVVQLAEHGGILIATSALLLTLPEVAAVIFYGLPMNPTTLDARIRQFIRVGRSGPVHVFAFTDESDTLFIERIQRKAIDIERALGSDELQQLLFEEADESTGTSQKGSDE